MKNLLTLFLLGAFTMINAQEISKAKAAILESVQKHEKELIRISDEIWAAAETAFAEDKSSELLATYAEQNGFKVTRGVAGLPTAFIAEYGSGKPIIGVMGEFDALPGLSQKTSPT